MLDFPDSPSDGEQSTQPNGITYQWDATLTRWTSVLSLGAGIVAGTVVQEQSFETGEGATGTTSIPTDDTIPQNTEGDEYMSLAFTPKYATSLLRIDTLLLCSIDIATSITSALFRDSIVDAVAAVAQYQATPTGLTTISMTHWEAAGSINATTFKVRAGGGGGGSFQFNGGGAGRAFGGVAASSITITEIQPNAVTVNSSNDFDNKLAGYLDTGLHEDYSGDLDLINTNSSYSFAPSNVTNAPADLVGISVIFTDNWATSNAYSVQRIYQIEPTAHKMWMRSEIAGVWTDWKLVVDGGAFTERLAGYLDTGQNEYFAGDVDTIERNSVFDVWAQETTNLPTDMQQSGILYHMSGSATLGVAATQVIFAYGSADDEWKQWMRTRIASVWGAWKLLADGSNKKIGASTTAVGAIRFASGLTILKGAAGIYDYAFVTPMTGDNWLPQITTGTNGTWATVTSTSVNGFTVITWDTVQATDAEHYVNVIDFN